VLKEGASVEGVMSAAYTDGCHDVQTEVSTSNSYDPVSTLLQESNAVENINLQSFNGNACYQSYSVGHAEAHKPSYIIMIILSTFIFLLGFAQ
jgi:hypothetical protein